MVAAGQLFSRSTETEWYVSAILVQFPMHSTGYALMYTLIVTDVSA